MSIYLKENLDISPLNISCQNSSNLIDPNSIMVEVEGLHAVATGNYTRYMPESLEKSVSSWTHPYNKPVIMHHNEDDGKIIGRIHVVEYKTDNTRSGTPALMFTINVPDDDGKKQIKDGRLSTVSVGINATDVRCSICGHNIAKYGKCEHTKGRTYDGEKCFWDIYEFIGKELSYVITPSDQFAHNLRIYSPTSNNKEKPMVINESMSAENTIIDDNIVDDNIVNNPQTDGNASIEASTQDNQASVETAESTADEPIPVVYDNQPNSESEDTSSNTAEQDVDNNTGDNNQSAIENADVQTPVNSQPVQESMSNTECVHCDPEYISISEYLTMARELSTLRAEMSGVVNNLGVCESRLYDITQKYKKLLADKLNKLRVKLGKSAIDTDTLMKRSDVSLEDSIVDCESELSIGTESAPSAAEIKENAEPSENTVSIIESLRQVESPIEILSTEDDKPQSKETKVDVNLKEQFSMLDKILFGR